MLAVQPVVFAYDPQLAEIPDRPARAGGEQAALLADRHAGRAGGAGGLHAAEGVFEHQAARRCHAEPGRGQAIAIRSRLAVDHVVAADQGAERRLQVVLAQHVVDACRPTAGDQRQGHVQPTQLADHRGDAGQQGTVGAFLQRIDPLLEDPPALHRQVAEQIVQGVAARATVHVVAQAVGPSATPCSPATRLQAAAMASRELIRTPSMSNRTAENASRCISGTL